MNVVVENPNDVPCIGVSDKNPYNQPSTSSDETEVPLYFGHTVVMVSPETVQNAVDIERVGMTLRHVCMFSIFSNALFLTVTLNPGFMFGMVMALFGFVGVRYYNKGFIFMYGVYEFITVCLCVYNLIVYILDLTSIIIFSLGTLFHGILVLLVYKFLRKFPQELDG